MTPATKTNYPESRNFDDNTLKIIDSLTNFLLKNYYFLVIVPYLYGVNKLFIFNLLT